MDDSVAVDSIGIAFEFQKADPTGRYVRGWASVVSVNGVPVVDHEGDVIAMDDLRPAAHAFVKDARVAKVMHEGEKKGEVVESVLVDDDFAKELGATSDRRGWWVGMEITSPSARERVRNGSLKAFSIGGSGVRTPME